MELKIKLFCVFVSLFVVANAVEVKYGDSQIQYQSRRKNLSSEHRKIENDQVNVVIRGKSGAVRPWPGKFNNNNDDDPQQRSSRSFEFGSSSGQQVNPLVNVTGRVHPPPPDEVAKMARYIVKTANWTSIATISTRAPMVGYPCASVFAVSDGPPGKSTGVPYMYVTAMDLSVQDLKVNPKTSLTMTLAQTDYCLNNKLDPEDPRCAHVILTGRFVKLQNGTDEASFAQQSLFAKHAVMATWPADHHFFFAKLDIKNILVLDYFGGAKTVSPKEYYRAKLYD